MAKSLHDELKDMAAFYLERPTKDANPSMTDMTRREANAVSELLLRAAAATSPN